MRAVRYVFCLHIISYVCIALFVLPTMGPDIHSYTSRIPVMARIIKESYPSDLNLTLDVNSHMHSSVQSPFIIVPAVKSSIFGAKNLAVIDTRKDPIEPSDSNSYFVLHAESAYIADQNTFVTISYKTIPSGTMTSAELRSYMDSLSSFVISFLKHFWLYLTAGLLLTSLLTAVSIAILHMLQGIILAWIVWIISSYSTSRYTLRTIYILGLYGSTLAFCVDLLCILAGYPAAYVYSATFLLWMMIVLQKIEPALKIQS